MRAVDSLQHIEITFCAQHRLQQALLTLLPICRFVTSLANAKGRAPNEAEDAQLAQCVWRSAAGAALGQQLEGVVHTAAAKLGIGACRRCTLPR